VLNCTNGQKRNPAFVDRLDFTSIETCVSHLELIKSKLAPKSWCTIRREPASRIYVCSTCKEEHM